MNDARRWDHFTMEPFAPAGQHWRKIIGPYTVICQFGKITAYRSGWRHFFTQIWDMERNVGRKLDPRRLPA